MAFFVQTRHFCSSTWPQSFISLLGLPRASVNPPNPAIPIPEIPFYSPRDKISQEHPDGVLCFGSRKNVQHFPAEPPQLFGTWEQKFLNYLHLETCWEYRGMERIWEETRGFGKAKSQFCVWEDGGKYSSGNIPVPHRVYPHGRKYFSWESKEPENSPGVMEWFGMGGILNSSLLLSQGAPNSIQHPLSSPGQSWDRI